MNDQGRMMFFNLFLIAASKTTACNFKKLQTFSQEMMATCGTKDEFADQVFVQTFKDLIKIIEEMR